MKTLIKTFFLVLMLVKNFAYASIIIDYYPRDIALGETIKLTLTLDNAAKTGSPNLMPLLKDFEVLSTARAYSFANINGKTSSKAQWTIIIKPKRAGKITIPAINIGNEQSQPFDINIQATNTDNTTKFNNASTYTILKTKINETKPFINQQTIYTVKLYNRQQLFDGQYKAPEVDNALIVPLGEGKTYQTTLNGEIYNIEEISYAIFPQHAGTLKITPPEFTAEVIDGFSPTRIHLKANPTVLNVKPLSTKKNIETWLAAENVTLKEEYDYPQTNYVAGDTFVRNITLKASGMVAELLPKLAFSNTDTFNVYVNKPKLKNTLVNGQIIATATYKITYLLTKAANTEIPSIKLPWYNIDTKTNMLETLPAKSLTISANNKNQPTPTTKLEINVEPHAKSQSLTTKILYIFGLSIFIFLLTIIISKIKARARTKNPWANTLLRKLARNSALQEASLRAESTQQVTSKPGFRRQAILKACKENDPISARLALLAFARQEWPELKILNLTKIPIDNIEFQQEMVNLTAAIYGKDQNNSWNGKNLAQIFTKLKINPPKNKYKKILPPMYLE